MKFYKLFVNARGKHYHRCEWCGLLMRCSDPCTQGGKFDPYGEEDVAKDGTLPGGHCDERCYRQDRPRGCQAHHDEDGTIIDLPEQTM